ncbi:uncharacterized protein SEPMUDRAFT_116583 [Sphaerulina musiva SO2202]|uniref:Uncharacterized protein n=1 Tax=Sphaerulina musiva (strain SO2202) TaxID=692275 RepID=M3D6P9_SPHMS|nr:uncharacterized protein SEPMUDRAFT_116583 [Sphaerulina musiva SO2202]EMF13549.1 hypothetical protein SEPMUDRAFT_116583 [Sphaerulina musiva SO2202]
MSANTQRMFNQLSLSRLPCCSPLRSIKGPRTTTATAAAATAGRHEVDEKDKQKQKTTSLESASSSSINHTSGSGTDDSTDSGKTSFAKEDGRIEAWWKTMPSDGTTQQGEARVS